MNLDLLAANLAAHWIQAGLIATATILALAGLRVKDPRLRLAALQTMVWLIVLVPWAQPWHQIDAATPVSTSAFLPIEGTSVAAAQPLSTPRAAASTIDLIPVALAIVVAGIVVRLAWLAYGGLCLVRFRRNGRAIPVPDVAEELQQRLKVSPDTSSAARLAALQRSASSPRRSPCRLAFVPWTPSFNAPSSATNWCTSDAAIQRWRSSKS